MSKSNDTLKKAEESLESGIKRFHSSDKSRSDYMALWSVFYESYRLGLGCHEQSVINAINNAIEDVSV